jgi:hypothetical protein
MEACSMICRGICFVPSKKKILLLDVPTSFFAVCILLVSSHIFF